jgi:hypothetical protein
LTIMSLNLTEFTPRTIARCDNWAFKVFLCCTLFIIAFSVPAIHSWPPLVKHTSILLACILPTAMVALSRAPTWINTKAPKEVLWVLLVLTLGLISSLLSENIWASLKSLVLFIASGPFIFIATKFLFESTKNQKGFLWVTSLGALALCFYAFYEYTFSIGIPHYSKIRLFSENPLPAGGLLILLSAGPIILLSRKNPLVLKIILALTLVSIMTIITLLAKKGPLLSLAVILLSLSLLISRKCLWLLFGFAFFSGCFLSFSETTLERYQNIVRLKESVAPRVENYFFGFHVFRGNPVWGVGFKTDLLLQRLEVYDLKSSDMLTKEQYRNYIEAHKTFENIILAFLVELGSLFTFTYFGGLIYITVRSLNYLHPPSQKDKTGLLVMSVLAGFVVLSLTFETLRFPSLNWMFHSFLGLMVSFVAPHSSESTKNIIS